jgi:hypothetical protein
VHGRSPILRRVARWLESNAKQSWKSHRIEKSRMETLLLDEIGNSMTFPGIES